MNGPPVSVSGRVRAIVTHNIDAFVQHLPHPGTAWDWQTCELAERTKQQLAPEHIRRAEYRDGWVTTERFYAYVVYHAGTTEDGVGCKLGQEQLFAPGCEPERPRARRVDGACAGEGGSLVGCQVSLSGDEVEVDESEEYPLQRAEELEEYAQLGDPVVRAERDAEQSSLGGAPWWNGDRVVRFRTDSLFARV